LGAARAGEAAPHLVVDPQDVPLHIIGWIGEEDTFKAPMRLIEKSGETTAVTYVASDLKQVGGDAVVTRDNVTVIGPTTLEGGSVTDVQVKITGVTEPGDYEGDLRIVLPGQHPLEALAEPIKLTARQRPVLDAVEGSKTLQLKVVNCRVACILAVLVPDRAKGDQFLLTFTNKNRQPITILDATVFLADTSGQEVEDVKVHLPDTPMTLPAKTKVEIPLTIGSGLLGPGHYSGTYSLVLEGATDPVTGSIDLSVRAEPLWALLLVAIGILLGRMARKAQGTTGPVPGVAAAALAAATPAPPWWKRLIHALSGVSSAATKWGRRVAIWFATFALILGVGFYNSYVKGGATFGSNPIVDILALVGYGLSGQVVGATLSSLPSVE
jgi:hypothetical protein